MATGLRAVHPRHVWALRACVYCTIPEVARNLHGIHMHPPAVGPQPSTKADSSISALCRHRPQVEWEIIQPSIDMDLTTYIPANGSLQR